MSFGVGLIRVFVACVLFLAYVAPATMHGSQAAQVRSEAVSGAPCADQTHHGSTEADWPGDLASRVDGCCVAMCTPLLPVAAVLHMQMPDYVMVTPLPLDRFVEAVRPDRLERPPKL